MHYKATGVIQFVRPEKDGDYHILVNLDPQYSNLTNSVNEQKMCGDLVLEPVCENTKDLILLPFLKLERRYKLQDPVLDMDDGRWAKIHPVSNMTVLSSSPLQRYFQLTK